jgi:hypothetical protein
MDATLLALSVDVGKHLVDVIIVRPPARETCRIAHRIDALQTGQLIEAPAAKEAAGISRERIERGRHPQVGNRNPTRTDLGTTDLEGKERGRRSAMLVRGHFSREMGDYWKTLSEGSPSNSTIVARPLIRPVLYSVRTGFAGLALQSAIANGVSLTTRGPNHSSDS